MDRREIDAALNRVQEMQTLVLDHQRFSGFSGCARMSGGVAALLTALVLRMAVPAEPRQQLMGWGVLLAFALGVNLAGLAAWFLRGGQGVRRAEWWPVFEIFPALSAGAALSLALILAGQFNLLFGMWMAVFGVAHMPYRRNLPFLVYCGGLVYIAAGVFCLLWPGVSFTDPRPMGLVFGLGELFGGWALIREQGKG
ncbi:MAG: hypothetical protein LBW77_01625 [Verrucomicrobiota bacterium]|jgi:hypothetical protein|nr:hypothetical protein [Verrucomicrobiota bacterium]